MKVGMFQTPFNRPERDATAVFDWAVRQTVVAEEVGFTECWFGEHQTLDWEGIPCPELVIAAAARETKNITLGPLAHLLPYHHPATLAIQTAWMSQILKGRYILGVAAGAYPTDAALSGITDLKGNSDMMYESIEMMERVWEAEPFQMEGKYWNAGYPDPTQPGAHMRDTRPYGGKMPMAMTGLSSPSPSINFAAKKGWIPASVYAGNRFLRTHFEDYERISRENGFNMDRSSHRVVRDVVVAETDQAARDLAINGGLGLAWKEYLTPTYKRFGIIQELMPEGDNTNPDDIDTEYLAEHVWIVGSPDTVRRKFENWFEELGGPFGTLLSYSHDFIDNPEPWEESMRLLAQEVAPKLP